MKHYTYNTKGVCCVKIEFDYEPVKYLIFDGPVVDATISNIKFISGCNGNLKAISLLLDGWYASDIEDKFHEHSCNGREYSCCQQLAVACKNLLNEISEKEEDK